LLFGKSARQKPPSSNQKRFGQKLPVGKSLPGQIVLYLITRFKSTPTACSMHYKTVAFPITTMSVRACIISDPMCTRCVHHTAHNNTVRVISISLWPTMATTYNITRTLVTSNTARAAVADPVCPHATPGSTSVSECSHFRICPSFRLYLAAVNIS